VLDEQDPAPRYGGISPRNRPSASTTARLQVIAREIEVLDVGPVTARERPDVARVGLGESSEHALHLIAKIVHEAACPVILLIHAPDPDFVK
jgi:hypothetical protein